MLLAVSAIGVVIARTGLVPKQISALGITFPEANRGTFVQIYILVVAYFIVGFVIYAAADLVAWRVEYNYIVREWQIAKAAETMEQTYARNQVEQDLMHAPWLGYRLWWHLSKPVALIRAIFEYALPVIVGSYAIMTLIRLMRSLHAT
jgi:hypothetical protein